ncbi:TRAM domain-containing protein [Candidatus Bathyarchaeota archaeon]|nr:MAG: TRAM domain-containing protein [Candidatus Bathyarchaeota archaeon]
MDQCGSSHLTNTKDCKKEWEKRDREEATVEREVTLEAAEEDDRGQDRNRGPAPVEEGQEVDVTIDSVGKRGDGIARINNFVVFVPGTNQGDQVKVRITSVRGNFATGEVVTGEQQ